MLFSTKIICKNCILLLYLFIVPVPAEGESKLSRIPSKKYFITSTPGVFLIDDFQSGGITLPWNEAFWLDVPSQAWLVLTNQKALSQSKIVLNIIQYKTILAA